MTAQDIWDLFECTYLEPTTASIRHVEHHLFDHATPGNKARVQGIRIGGEVNGQPMLLTGEGNDQTDAAVHALKGAGIQVQVRSYEERSTRASTHAGDAQACAFLESEVA